MGRDKRGVTTRLDEQEEQDFERLVRRLSEDEKTMRMRDYIQHGTITTHEHCMDVARCAFKLNRRLHLHADEQALVEAGYLHDYYLYDIKAEGLSPYRHGTSHPGKAAENAGRDFGLTPNEINIIRGHMWPLTLAHPPKSREAILVSLADKEVATVEFVRPELRKARKAYKRFKERTIK